MTSDLSKVAIYLRVSADEQKELGTIQNQINYAKEFIEEHRLIVYDWYMDDGISGSLPMDQRPNGARLLSDADLKRYQTVYCYNSNRWARETLYYLQAERYLRDRGIQLKFMTEEIDFSSPSGRMQATFFAGMAEYEKSQILERTLNGRYRIAAEGFFPGSAVPYGYRSEIDPNKRRKVLVIDEEQAKVVRRIFHMIGNEGKSSYDVEKLLNAEGVPVATVAKGIREETLRRWHAEYIRQLVNNPVYKGDYYFGRGTPREVLHKVPAVVSPELFEAVQRQLALNKKADRKQYHKNYILTGVSFCGICGYSICGSSYLAGSVDQKTRKRIYAYICHGTKLRSENGIRCDNHKRYNAEKVEHLVWDNVVYWLTHPQELSQRIKLQLDESMSEVGPVEKELDDIERVISQKITARKKIRDMVYVDLITIDEARGDLEQLQKELEVLQARKEELRNRHAHFEEAQAALYSLEFVLRKLKKNAEEADVAKRKEVIRNVVERIIFYRDYIIVEYIFGGDRIDLLSSDSDRPSIESYSSASRPMPTGCARG